MLWLALLLRVLTPPGYMLAPAPGAGLPYAICTAHGVEIVAPQGGAAEPERGPRAPDADPEVNQLCAWAGFGAPLLATPSATCARIQWTCRRPLHAADPDGRPGRGLAAPPPPSTGPPALDLIA